MEWMSALSCIWNQLAQTAAVNQSGQGKTQGGRERVREERYIEMGMRARLVGMVGGGCSQTVSYITFFSSSISCPWSACFSLSWIQSSALLLSLLPRGGVGVGGVAASCRLHWSPLHRGGENGGRESVDKCVVVDGGRNRERAEAQRGNWWQRECSRGYCAQRHNMGTLRDWVSKRETEQRISRPINFRSSDTPETSSQEWPSQKVTHCSWLYDQSATPRHLLTKQPLKVVKSC